MRVLPTVKINKIIVKGSTTGSPIQITNQYVSSHNLEMIAVETTFGAISASDADKPLYAWIDYEFDARIY